jgi:hypothetical protein
VEPAEQEVLEQLLDGLDVDEQERGEVAVGREDALGDQEVGVGMEVGREGAEGLEGGDASGNDVLASEVSMVGAADGVVGGPGQEAQKAARFR